MGMFQRDGVLGGKESILSDATSTTPERLVREPGKMEKMAKEAYGSETGIDIRNKVSDVLKSAGSAIKPGMDEKVKKEIVAAKNSLINMATSFFEKPQEDKTEMEKVSDAAENLWEKLKGATDDAVFDSRTLVGELLEGYGDKIDPSMAEEITSFVDSKMKIIQEETKLSVDEKKSKLVELKDEMRESIMNMINGVR